MCCTLNWKMALTGNVRMVRKVLEANGMAYFRYYSNI
jgi:hypothetical protein